MNSYELKQEARRARFDALAAKAEAEKAARYEAASEMSSAIPFGQPVHGLKDRKYREKISLQMDKGYQAGKKAEYYRMKAEAVGTAGISSDDPDAIKKIGLKLENLKARQELMKATNRAIRLKDMEKGNKKLAELGFSEKEIQQLRDPGDYNIIGYPSYELSSNNANIRRLEQRIKLIKESQEAQEKAETIKTGLYTYTVDDNRVQFIFDSKPAKEVRNILKRHSFRWSPSRGAWVRQATRSGFWAAEDVRKELDQL